MHTLELQSNIASVALSQVLIDSGFEVTGVELGRESCVVTLDSDDAARLAEALAAFLQQDWLNGYISQRMLAEYPFLDADEQEYVSLLTLHAIRRQQPGDEAETLGNVTLLVLETLVESRDRDVPFNLDAVMRFRFRDRLKGVDKAIDTMVEQFLGDREYEEFVSMLRYMLDAQPPTEQTLHVFCTDERVWICDAAGELVRDNEVTAAAHVVSDGEDVNSEDLAMSVLIMRSPCRIVIHDVSVAAPWPSFAETVERVFLDRAGRCESCSTCQGLKRANQHALPENDYTSNDGATRQRPAVPHLFD